MDLEQIKQILDLVREHDLSEFEIEHDGLRLKVRKDTNGSHVVTLPAPPAPLVLPPSTASPSSTAPAPAAPAMSAPTMAAAPADAGDAEIELAVVKSPIVGTFYRSSEPGSASFVDIGSIIKKGDVLCIIEAMKLMNEIETDRAGVVKAILVENGQPVEYGQPLVVIV